MMKKSIAVLSLLALVLGPVQALAAPTVNPGVSSAVVGTELTQATSTSAVDPIVIKAKWEMRAKRSTDAATSSDNKIVGYWTDGTANDDYWYEDDNPTARTAGAQFYPSGDENVFSQIAVCGVIDHPWLRNPSDLSKFVVSADIYYPNVNSVGKNFCGAFYKEIALSPLSYNDGIKLLCGSTTPTPSETGIFTRDPGIVQRYGFSESDICYQLSQEQSKVFCGIMPLSYEAPAGDYTVKLFANAQGLSQVTQTNKFAYYQLPSFKIDFPGGINFGKVDTNTENNLSGTVEGDTIFSLNDTRPTIKGTGNVQLNIKVEQNNMGFGERTLVDGTVRSNVQYKARLGSLPNWTSIGYYKPTNTSQVTYSPFINLATLDLSQDQKMDFGILVEKFPPEHTSTAYSGSMTLTGTALPFTTCNPAPGSPS